MLAIELASDAIVAIPIGWASVVALVIPVLTAIVTRYRAASRLPQAVVAFVASGALAVVQMLTDDMPNDTLQALVAGFLGVFVPMLAAYLGFWQPVAKVNERIAPDTGI